MNIRIKTIVLTLTILITTLLLNSLLSLASFEKIYVKSLISIYEMAGKNLKKKIERSLRFGKPLDRFQGMDALLKELIKKEPEIARVDIISAAGKIMYHVTGNKNMYGEIPFDISAFDKKKDEPALTKLINGMYWINLPLYDGSDKIVALLRLSFSREVVYAKLKEMALESFDTLWMIMLLTSMGLVFFLGLLISRPIKREIKAVSDMLEWPGDPGQPDYKKIDAETDGQNYSHLSITATAFPQDTDFSSQGNFKYYDDIKKIKNEIHRLGWYVHGFALSSTVILHIIDELILKQRDMFELCENPNEFEILVRQIVEKENLQFKDYEKELLERIIRENRHIVDKLRIFSDFLEVQRNVRTNATPHQ